MKIAVVCSDARHPVMPHLEDWCRRMRAAGHETTLFNSVADLGGGDIAFLISCSEIVRREVSERFAACLVVHASDLPAGRGWSPLVWQIIEGRNEIAVTLLEAASPVDSGAIWHKRWLHFDGTELHDEINRALITAEIELMDYAVSSFGRIEATPQDARTATHYRKRGPEDSRLDPEKSLADQFDLLRVADPVRYPAFFELRGQRYEIEIRKAPQGSQKNG